MHSPNSSKTAWLGTLCCAAFFALGTPAHSQDEGPRKVFTNSVAPLPTQASVQMAAASVTDHSKDKLEILFALETPKDATAELEKKVAAGERVDTKDFQEKYAAPSADYDSLLSWLKEHGFQITSTSPDRTSIYAKGTVEQIEKSLQVKMARVTVEGITYNAVKDAPSLPTKVGDPVHAIIGLQPFQRANKHSVIFRPPNGNRQTGSQEPPDALLASAPGGAPAPAPNIANQPPYLVPEILQAYHANNLGVTGAGETIAILIDTVPKLVDLKGFWHANGLPDLSQNVKQINVNAVNLPPREGEETLDVEWTSGTAPGAKIRIYAAGDLSFVSLDKALDRIIADLGSEKGLHQLSISLGLGEKYLLGAIPGEMDVEHGKFLRLAAGGVNVFVSTGDAGSNPQEDGHATGGDLQAEYSSTDPLVVAVGGTSLMLDANGQISNEIGWTAGGGGESVHFQRPAWQTGAGLPTGNKRLVPDVSLAADPDTGAYLFYQGQGGGVGGTSWSAPVWAGFCALINEARAKAGKPSLTLLNPLLYPLNGKAAFNDITVGSNGHYQAGAGHDMVTGLGTPNVAELVQALKN